MTKPPKITEAEVGMIKDAQAGSQKAFSRLFYKYKNFVENILYQYLKDKDEAKDLTNIVFLKVNEKLSKFTDYHSFGGWLRILTKNTAIDYLRTVKTNSISVDANDDLQILADEDETSQINKMTYNYLMDQIDILSPSYREVCTLFYRDNLTVSQISEALNIPSGTIKSDLSRMRKKLQKQLKVKQ